MPSPSHKWLILLLNLTFITLVFLFLAPVYNLESYINYLFYLFLTYLVIVLFLFTKKGGFYDGVTFGFRRFKNIMSKNKDYMEEWKSKPAASENVSLRFYLILRFQVILLFLLLAILLTILYV